MKSIKRSLHLLLFAAASLFLLAGPVLAADGESTVKGLITSINGNNITLRDANNAEQTISVSPDTTYKMTKGLTGVIHDKVEMSALMRGLPITAQVVSDGASGWTATSISFKAEDHRTAQQVSAGIASTEQRIDDFGTYEALAQAEVHFASGKTAINSEGRAALDGLAAKAKETNGYHIVLQGFTDSVGNAAANQRLSTMRAAAVSNYLQQTSGLMPGRVHTPDGMGIAPDAGTGSNANARRVVAKLVVDKGVNGSNN